MTNKRIKKVCVTGGAGFIGSYLSESLLSSGFQVLVIDNLSTGKKENLPKDCEFIQLDLGTGLAGLFKILKGVDYVFHLAAIPRTQYCVENPFECHGSTVNGTLNILEASKKNKVKKFILISSCAIYGIQKHLPIPENAILNLKTPYALQKYIQELYTQLYTQLYDLPSIILRLFNVYGTKRESEEGSYPNVLAAFSKQMREKGKIFITSDGKQRRDYVHVFDVINAIIIAAESQIKDSNIFNIGTGRPIDINQIAKSFPCEKEYIAARPGEARNLYADISKARMILKWEPKISFEQGMEIWKKS